MALAVARAYTGRMQRLVHALDAVKATRSRREKVKHLATLLRALPRDELPLAARLLLGQLLPPGDARTLGVGFATLTSAAAAVAGLPLGAVALRARQAGDLGDALEALLPSKAGHLPLREVGTLLDALAATGDRARKQALLEDALRRAAPWEARYLARALLGELRVGVQAGVFLEALAAAFEVPHDLLRKASALTPDPGALALRALEGRLGDAALEVGRPVAFMLASPHDAVKEPLDPARTMVEDKLDGIRAQAHVKGGRAQLFARGHDEVTAQFPEVVAALAVLAHPVVLDGELLAVHADGRPRPFQALQQRLGRVAPGRAALELVPVQFVAFDCLYDGEPLLDRPWHERQARLCALPVRVNPAVALDPKAPLDAQLEARFAEALARGHEGLVLKRTDAPYEAGHRGGAWRKVKRALGTLDVVITRAELGHGKRAGQLSDYTFAVWRDDDLVELGRAFSGLTDAELAVLGARLEALTVAQDGAVRLVKPEVVLEVAFDGIQASTRHASGYALRFPRIVRVRDDKRAADADKLETVQALFAASVAAGRGEAQAQLGLFDPRPSR